MIDKGVKARIGCWGSANYVTRLLRARIAVCADDFPVHGRKRAIAEMNPSLRRANYPVRILRKEGHSRIWRILNSVAKHFTCGPFVSISMSRISTLLLAKRHASPN